MNVFCDTTNLYHTARRRYNGLIDYEGLIEYLYDKYNIISLHYYVVRCGRKADPFIEYLKHLSPDAQITIKEPYPVRMNGREVLLNSFNVEIAVDALAAVGPVIICSSNYDLLPLLTVLDNPVIHAISIPHVFKTIANCFELEEGLIKEEVLV